MSQIMALTFQNNPDAARGKDAEEIFFEESGAFGTPGLLKQSLVATNDCVMAGSIKTGMITVFGTSGDMDGGTADYSEMFNNPLAFGFLPFKNVWDENAEESSVGFFHPINWNMEGYYDEQGNSDTKKAKEFEEKDRKELLDAGATSIQISQRMQEKPLTPTEAFNLVSTNNYPVLELNRRLHKVKSQHLQEKLGRLVDFYMDDSGTVKTSTILDGSKTAITSLQDIPKDPRGCPIIYEDPVPNAPKGLYKIGYDPVRQDSGTSLAAIIVYKGVYRGDYRHSVIVAEYVGRYETTDDIDRLASFFAMYYNTQIMYENEVTSVKRYFQQRKILHLLAEQPDNVISKNIKKSRVSRTFGCHMTGPLKDAGERYIKDWLLTELDTIIDEDGNKQVITVIDTINSRRLLEELIKYNREGNFDLHSALIMCIFQVQEETFEKEYGEEKSNKRIEQLLNSMHRRFK